MTDKIIKSAVSWAVLAGLFLLFSCSDNSPTTAGSGSETQNAMVSGHLYNSDGTPANHAKVRFITVDHNPYGAAKRFATTDSVYTDSTGWYGTNNLSANTYNVFAEGADDSLSFQDSVVFDGDTTKVPADTLAMPGSLRGFIKLQPGDDVEKVIVIIMGSNKFNFVGSAADFALDSLAAGIYHVKFFSTLDNYDNLDTFFTITAGADINLGADSIVMPLKIPIPTNFLLSYDTLKQIVSLSWDRMDPAKVAGYKVYRQRVGGADSVLTSVAIADTFYADSTGVQDERYEYKVVAVSPNDMEGTKSAGLNLKVVSGYQVIDTLPKGLLAEKGGIVFVAQIATVATGSKVTVQSYDSQFQVQSSIQLDSVLDQPQGFDMDSAGNLYVIDLHGIYKFSPTGILLDTIDIWSNNENKTLVVYDTLVLLASGVIREYSLGGDSLAAINQMPDFRADGLVVHKGRIFAGGNRNEIRIYDLNLQFIESWILNFTHDETVWGLATDELDNIYVLGYHSNPNFCTMLIYNSAQTYIGKIDIGANAKYFVASNGNIFLNQDNNLLVLRLRQ
ncbi:MAG: hypothetical protein A2293_10655 [Elusimicrobia bacterium RIFOXYB2_FULL_49_7]|nr:MAG: hypothetical protein A2293_10655 [Elusimicrobia bacterium RIFOXYB2_FULL_49_7]